MFLAKFAFFVKSCKLEFARNVRPLSIEISLLVYKIISAKTFTTILIEVESAYA